MLSDDEKSRIKEEEIFRNEVRQQLEAEKPAPSKKKRFWSFVNSSFAIWLLSTLVVGLFGWAYSSYQEHRKETNQVREMRRRLATEINNRVRDTTIFLKGVQSGLARKNMAATHGWVYARCVDRLDGIEGESKRPLPSIYPEYKERSFPSLLTELQGSTGGGERLTITSVSELYERMKILSLDPQQYSSGGQYTEEDTKDGRTAAGDVETKLKEISKNMAEVSNDL